MWSREGHWGEEEHCGDGGSAFKRNLWEQRRKAGAKKRESKKGGWD